MFFGLRQFLNLVTVGPAVKKTRSEGFDVARKHSCTLATLASFG